MNETPARENGREVYRRVTNITIDEVDCLRMEEGIYKESGLRMSMSKSKDVKVWKYRVVDPTEEGKRKQAAGKGRLL